MNFRVEYVRPRSGIEDVRPKVKLFPALVGAEANTSLPDRYASTVFFW